MSVTFYRDLLRSDQAREFYDAMCSSISNGNLGGIFPLSYRHRATAMRDSFDAVRALRTDRPDFFFIGRKSRAILRGDRLVLMNEVLYTPEQIDRINTHLNKALEDFTAGTVEKSDWEREKIVYERLVRYLTYADHSTNDEPKEYDHNIVGPLLQNSGVCEGFSSLLVLALRKAGIPCIQVIGRGREENHSWNMAWINGSPAHLDVTWDCGSAGDPPGFFYFNLTDEQISRDHKITTKGLPACLDPTNGYHFHEGVLFATPREASGYFRKAFSMGTGPYSVRFSHAADMKATINKAMRHAPVHSYSFRYNDTQGTAMVWSS